MKYLFNLATSRPAAVRTAAHLLVLPGFALSVTGSPGLGHLLMLAGTLLLSLDLGAEFQSVRYNSRGLQPA